MQFEEKLDVIEEDIAQYSRELLDILPVSYTHLTLPTIYSV